MIATTDSARRYADCATAPDPGIWNWLGAALDGAGPAARLAVLKAEPVVRAARPCTRPSRGRFAGVSALRVKLGALPMWRSAASPDNDMAGVGDLLRSAAGYVLAPRVHGRVDRVACVIPPNAWLNRGFAYELRALAAKLGRHRGAIGFEVPFDLLSRAGSTVTDVCEDAGFAGAPLWISLDTASLPLIRELEAYRPAALVAPDDLVTAAPRALARELGYYLGLAQACGSDLLVPNLTCDLVPGRMKDDERLLLCGSRALFTVDVVGA